MAFRVRAAAIVIREGHVLAVRHKPEPYWSLPGGGIESSESSAQAALRELLEETGAPGGQIDRLGFIVENHFTDAGNRMEEIGFYYLVNLPADALPLRTETFPGGEARLTLRWLPIVALTQTDLRPAPLKAHLANMPDRLTHILNVE